MNHYDAFSHSQQCDGLLTGPVITCPGYGDYSILDNKVYSVLAYVPGTEQSHEKCLCWCHNTEYLFSSPEPEYDFSPPPEYLSSADRAFIVDEPAHIRVGFSSGHAGNQPSEELGGPNGSAKGPTYFNRAATDRGAVVLDSCSNEIEARPIGSIDIFTGPANKAGFTNWSRQELRSGKCETCGDALADCECVE